MHTGALEQTIHSTRLLGEAVAIEYRLDFTLKRPLLCDSEAPERLSMSRTTEAVTPPASPCLTNKDSAAIVLALSPLLSRSLSFLALWGMTQPSPEPAGAARVGGAAVRVGRVSRVGLRAIAGQGSCNAGFWQNLKVF